MPRGDWAESDAPAPEALAVIKVTVDCRAAARAIRDIDRTWDLIGRAILRARLAFINRVARNERRRRRRRTLSR